MSYSFSVKQANKAAAIDAVYFELRKVAERDPIHEADVPGAMTAAAAIINALSDDDSMDVAVSMSGSVSWTGRQGEPQPIVSVGTSISAALTSRPLKL
jgi:hypothetical protein